MMEYQPAAATRNGNRKGKALKGKLINAVAYFREPQQELKQYGKTPITHLFAYIRGTGAGTQS